MSKRLQVLLEEAEMRELRRARRDSDVDLLVEAEKGDEIDAVLHGLGYRCLHRSADAANYARGDEHVDLLYASRPIARRLLAAAGLYSPCRSTQMTAMTGTLAAELSSHRAELARICERLGVRRLEIFGSATRPGKRVGDLDFPVDLGERPPRICGCLFPAARVARGAVRIAGRPHYAGESGESVFQAARGAGKDLALCSLNRGSTSSTSCGPHSRPC